MEKEIHEQPYVIHETLRMYMDHKQIKIDELDKMDWHFEDFNRVYFIGCGTAYHACLYAQYLFDKWLNIPSFACQPVSFAMVILNWTKIIMYLSKSIRGNSRYFGCFKNG